MTKLVCRKPPTDKVAFCRKCKYHYFCLTSSTIHRCFLTLQNEPDKSIVCATFNENPGSKTSAPLSCGLCLLHKTMQEYSWLEILLFACFPLWLKHAFKVDLWIRAWVWLVVLCWPCDGRTTCPGCALSPGSSWDRLNPSVKGTAGIKSDWMNVQVLRVLSKKYNSL